MNCQISKSVIATIMMSTIFVSCCYYCAWNEQTDGLVQEKRISSALAMELRLSCTNPSKWEFYVEICRSSPYILRQNSIFVGILINEVYLFTYKQQYLP